MVRRDQAGEAEVLALEALAFLAASPDDLAGFMAVSGIAPAQLRALASEPHFLGGVLDYFLANEELLTRFCDARGVAPEAVHRKRAVLSGSFGRSPE